MEKSSLTVVTFGCAAAVVFALVGAAYALDAPKPAAVDVVLKGDREAEAVPLPGGITLEEANVDAGISNLILVEREPAAL